LEEKVQSKEDISRLTILVVDDEEMNIDLLVETLYNDYEVSVGKQIEFLYPLGYFSEPTLEFFPILKMIPNSNGNFF